MQYKNGLNKPFNSKLVTSTGFEPVNAAVKGRCVKPLHQLAKAMAPETGLEPVTCRLTAGRSTD